MATEEQKKENFNRLIGITLDSIITGMWDLFGESSFATSKAIGEQSLAIIQKEGGAEIAGVSPEHVMTELFRLATDEIGIIEGGSGKFENGRITLNCEKCMLAQLCNQLQTKGVQPYYCFFYCLTSSVIQARVDKKNRFVSRKWDAGSKTCSIEIQIME